MERQNNINEIIEKYESDLVHYKIIDHGKALLVREFLKDLYKIKRKIEALEAIINNKQIDLFGGF